MDLGIKGKRALLLAASGGLGFASALALSREGVEVAVSSSNLERAEAAAQKITNETGNKVISLLGDLSGPANMDKLADEANSGLGGGIDILLLNHGGPPMQTATEVSQENLSKQNNMMVLSQIRITQTLLPPMIAQKWGRIFLVGASAVSQPIPGNVLSNLYRSGMAQYCKTLAGEVIEHKVTVNVVSPMTILTNRTRSMAVNAASKKGVSPEEELANREANLPSGRFGDPEEYGAMIAYLSGQYAGYCTGANWRVDGGNVKAL